MFVLFTDTDSDTTPEVAKEYGYNLISMPYTIDDKEVYPYKDFDKFDSKTFYQSLREGKMPKTSAISPEDYYNYFEPFFKEGKDILYVHFSSSMSGTFNAMRIAERELKEKYPERTLYTIDTKGITICQYLLVREIGDLYKQGKTLEEILSWANEEIEKTATYFFAEDLTFFKRSGRVKNFTAFIGNLLGIRPIIYMDANGNMTSIDKARGSKATVSKMIHYVTTLQEDIKNHRVIIGHTDCLSTAQSIGDKLKEIFGDDLNIEYVVVNPTAGSHCGPGCVGIAFHAIHR